MVSEYHGNFAGHIIYIIAMRVCRRWIIIVEIEFFGNPASVNPVGQAENNYGNDDDSNE
jgi:hypothetical protein